MKKNINNSTQHKSVTILRFLYPLWAVLGIFSLQYIPSVIIVANDALATANNIVNNELLFSMGIVGSLVVQLIHIAVVLVLYDLFKSVNKNQASLIVVFGLVGVPITMLNSLNQVAAALLAKGTGYLTAFEPAQLQSLMMFFLDLHNKGMVIAWLFWGLWLLPQAYLIYKSEYFPKIFSILMALAGLSYFFGTFAYFLLPNYATIAPIFDFLTMGEVAFMTWVIFKGAKLKKR